MTWQGYTTSFGDLGKATIDAGANAIVIVNITGQSNNIFDLIVTNNGSTNVNGLTCTTQRNIIARIVAHDIGGMGISATSTNLQECEAYLCNVSNTANLGGMSCMGAINCIAHDNAGSNSSGIMVTTFANFCIADTNGQYGFFTLFNSNIQIAINGCDAYNNGAAGIRASNGSSGIAIRNCNLLKNATYGIDFNAIASSCVILENNGYGSGTQANATANINAVAASSNTFETGAVTYASGATPWVDPANGDFRINLATAINAGRGTFTQTQASYTGTIGYPDIGAAQHLESGGAGPIGRLVTPVGRGTPY